MTLLITLFGVVHLLGQCSYDVETVIADASTTELQLQVSNAANNDLSAVSQCVQEISIQFRHQFVGDLWVDLTSPAGQSVRLMGPGLPSSPPTQLINWDITMVSCDSTAIPDLGFPAVWDNLAPWAILSTYTGSYYPYQGCLEDFDMGSVNGVWTLTFADISQIGAGVVESFSITFCDGSEIVCGVCEIEVPIVSMDTSFHCDGDFGQVSGLLPVYPSDYVLDPSRYTYGYGIFASNVLVAYADEPAIEDYGVGTYQICPLSYQSSIDDMLPAEGSILTPQNWVSSIENLQLCAAASSTCHNLVILSQPDTLRAALDACLGSPILYNGVSYTEPDTVYEFRAGPFCDTVLATVLEFVDPQPLIVDSAVVITCTDDQVWLSLADGDSVTSTYEWSTIGGNILASQGDSVLVNAAGQYTVVVNDRGCIGTTSTAVSSDDTQPEIEVVSDVFDCATDTVPLYLISADSLSIRWQRPSQTISVADTLLAVTPGIYQVTATATNGCQTIESFELFIDTTLITPSASAAAITCADPSTDINVVGIVSGYTYSWTGPSFSSSSAAAADLLVGGVYTMTYVGDNACVDSISVQVVDQREYPVLDFDLTPVNCDSLGTPAIVSSNLPISNVSWRDLLLGDVIFGDTVVLTQGGFYELAYTTASGCIRDTVIDVPVDTISPVLAVVGGVLDCIVDSVRLDVFGDTTDLSLAWTGPGMFESDSLRPFVSIAGDYILTVTSDNSCSAEVVAKVTRSADRPDVDFVVVPITCNNDTATISVSDPTFDYSWSDNLLPLNSDSCRIAMPGEVFVTVTNNITGCDDTYSFEIEDVSDGPMVELEALPLTCNTDSVLIEVNVFDSLSAFSWIGVAPQYAASLQPYITTPDTVILTTVNIYGCSAIDTFIPIDQTKGPTITFTDTTLTCDRPVLELTPITNIPFDSVVWTGPGLSSAAINARITTPGIYTLEAYTANGCVTIVQQEVRNDNAPPLINVLSNDALTCVAPATTLEISVDTARMIQWRDPSQSIVGDTTILRIDEAGRYTVIVTGVNGCVATANIDVTSEIVFPQVSFDIDQIDCDTDTATITSVSSISDHMYRWLDGNVGAITPIIEVDMVGSYRVEVTNQEGCVDTFTASVLLDTISPNPLLLVEDTLSCTDPDIYITGVTSDYRYIWQDIDGVDLEQDTLVVSDPGLYEVLLIGENGCITSTTAIVEIDTNALVIDLAADTLSCSEGKVSAIVTGNKPVVTASWSGPFMYTASGAEVTVFSPGLYQVSASGPNGCETTDSIVVVKDESVPDFQINEAFLPCDASGSVLGIMSLDSIYTIRWFGPSSFFSEEVDPQVFEPGQYVAVATSASGCPSRDTLFLDFDTDLPIFGAEIDTFFCDQQVIDLVATDVQDDVEVQWLGPSGFDVLSSQTTATDTGQYQLIVTGLNKCKDTLNFTPFDDRTDPVIVLSQLDSLVCEQTAVTLLAVITDSLPDPVLAGEWSSGGFPVSTDLSTIVSEPGTYTFQATNARNSCTSSAVIEVDQIAYPEVTFDLSLLDATCAGFQDASVLIDSVSGGFAPYQFALNGSDFSTNQNFEFLAGGTFTVVSIDRYGCLDSITVDLAAGADPAVILPADTVLTLGDSLLIDADILLGNGLITDMMWQTSSPIGCDTCSSIVVQPSTNMLLTFTVTDDLGCVGADDIFIVLNRQDEVDLANVFSPVGDPDNRVFFFPDVPGVEIVESLRIYDRQGNLVYEALDAEPGDPAYGWDGIFRGELAVTGTYVYYISVMYLDGSSKLFVGDLTLLR